MKQTSAESSKLTEDGKPQAASSKRSRTYRKLVGTLFDSSEAPNIDRLWNALEADHGSRPRAIRDTFPGTLLNAPGTRRLGGVGSLRFVHRGQAESSIGAVLSLSDQAWPCLCDWDDDGDQDLLIGDDDVFDLCYAGSLED